MGSRIRKLNGDYTLSDFYFRLTRISSKCGVTFTRVVELDTEPIRFDDSRSIPLCLDPGTDPMEYKQETKRKREHEDSDDTSRFKRIRVISIKGRKSSLGSPGIASDTDSQPAESPHRSDSLTKMIPRASYDRYSLRPEGTIVNDNEVLLVEKHNTNVPSRRSDVFKPRVRSHSDASGPRVRHRRASNESAKSRQEFQYYGRHANSWLFNDFSITDSVKKGWGKMFSKSDNGDSGLITTVS